MWVLKIILLLAVLTYFYQVLFFLSLYDVKFPRRIQQTNKKYLRGHPGNKLTFNGMVLCGRTKRFHISLHPTFFRAKNGCIPLKPICTVTCVSNLPFYRVLISKSIFARFHPLGVGAGIFFGKFRLMICVLRDLPMCLNARGWKSSPTSNYVCMSNIVNMRPIINCRRQNNNCSQISNEPIHTAIKSNFSEFLHFVSTM